ncbi:HAD family phosphatase [Candidatus Bipolaricaulota bacterium]|nr:HAD family phosphatase [Candidatus Bipolaricaulota bacterium]
MTGDHTAKIKTVIFDLDGTLVRYHGVEFESSWGAIGVAAGVGEEWDRLLAAYINKPLLYSEWMAKSARLLAGIPLSKVTEKIFPPPYAHGAAAAIKELKGKYQLGILSSGVDLVAERVKTELGLDFTVANRLYISDGHFTGETETVVDLWKKDQVLKQLATEKNLSLPEVCFIGDHFNDIAVMGSVGASIAYNPKDERLVEIADMVTTDFREVSKMVEMLAKRSERQEEVCPRKKEDNNETQNRRAPVCLIGTGRRCTVIVQGRR